ncbi:MULTISPECIES: protein DpdE [Rhodococcus]|uniref:Protein DpdE n=1 Tax=Rhodococcus oxybenzonivorans TaxID=1990687 RepID=A0AAE4V1D4_9NOCA|nr:MULTISPECIES: protein DpdE [Rhodococcus]MDV7245328.1 protein DpdE [Rhodococcus oxybenzonivorans]MDV7266099.1 protein DpdE [Rhodococcus oxybenzonivorans]MDV7272392.1 protein DpdE [Rhodococcus oxybenzonivorans]MDV7336353.1 protein DpdE [Rhodococcus oxybenzonivorans]MDV7347653.1 protein DpdE [Rhodococcus oxybenzonivorans]
MDRHGTDLPEGCFVDFPDAPGLGKISSVGDGHSICIDFFESIAQPVAATVTVSECTHVEVPPETRAFWRDPDTHQWRACRVKGNSGSTYYVHFPNSAYDSAVEEPDLYVRWDRPVVDPVDVLVTGGNESAYFYHSRIPFLHNIVAQEAASSGISALLSSAVELYPHQVNAALTVLSDPVQRYLLADEVGLGKTIEAGYVIRQTLLDNPTATVTILAPGGLRTQWREELSTKFFTDDFPRARIRISSHDTPEKWCAYAGSDLVVVDEAHRIALTGDPASSPYRELVALAHSSERLLLLSATPASTHWRMQLGFLHLLDPELYSWHRTDEFEHKYAIRTKLADSVYQLDSEYPQYIRDAIQDITEVIPDDPRFQDLGERVLSHLGEYDDVRDDVDPVVFSACVEALRAHISETYRIHRRVIRNRRAIVLRESSTSELLPYEVRGRSTPHRLRLESDVRGAHDALVNWQVRVAEHLVDHSLEADAEEYAIILAILASRLPGPVSDLLNALRWRVNRDHDAALRAGLSAPERDALGAAPIHDFEHTVIDQLAERDTPELVRQDTNALLTALRPVLKAGERGIVFCGPGSLARDLYERMRQRFPKALVVLHDSSMSDEDAHSSLTTWNSHDTSHRGIILLIDASGEDGLNLQKADVAVHVRVPWSPNQLEQRLGRIDRYPGHEPGAPRMPAHAYAVGDQEGSESFSSDWLELLENGYQIFENSVSSMQTFIAHSLPSVWVQALLRGPGALRLQSDKVRESLQSERKEIEKFDMLDSIDDASADPTEVTRRLDAFEAEWRSTQRATTGFAGAGEGGINVRYSQVDRRGCPLFTFDLLGSRPFVSPRLYREVRAKTPSIAMQGTFNRNAGLRAPGTRMLRRGNPVVDLLDRVCRVDDRGQAYAFERTAPGVDGEPQSFFKFDLVVEPDIGPALTLLPDSESAARAVRRRALSMFPPFTLEIWIPAAPDAPLPLGSTLTLLQRPYNNRRDRNFNAERISRLLEVFGGWREFEVSARRAQDRAVKYLTDTSQLVERCEEHAARTEVNLEVLRAQSEARRAAGRLLSDFESQQLDLKVGDALVSGIRQPQIHTVAAGCVVLTDPKQRNS